MGRIKEIYRKNIYAIIGTLIFHILLLATFILAGVDTSGYFKDEGIVIDFEEIPDIPPLEEEQQDENTEATESEEANISSMSNRAVNKAAPKTKDKLLNDDFMREMEAAQKLAQDVSNQLKKEIVDIEDMPMPEVTNDEQTDSDEKNVINYGESRNYYELKDRYHTRFFIPTYLAQKGGVITVDIIVNRNGKVISAIVRNSEQFPTLSRFAKSAALRSRFNKSPQAPEKQKGTITYTFIAQ